MYLVLSTRRPWQSKVLSSGQLEIQVLIAMIHRRIGNPDAFKLASLRSLAPCASRPGRVSHRACQWTVGSQCDIVALAVLLVTLAEPRVRHGRRRAADSEAGNHDEPRPEKLNAGRPLAQGSGSCSESAAHCTPAPSGSESRAAGDRDRGLLRPDLVMFPRRRPGALRASEARASTPGPGRRFHPRHPAQA